MQLLEGRRKEAWLQLSSMMALVHNLWASKARGPEEFNPTRIRVPGVSGDKMVSAAKGWLQANGD